MKLALSLLYVFFILKVHSQNFNSHLCLFSEQQNTNGRAYIELYNKQNLKIKSLKIINEIKDEFDTIAITQSIIDSLSKPNALIVIIDSSLKNVQYDKYTTQKLLINDSTVEDLYPYVNTNNGESIIYIDSAELHRENYLTSRTMKYLTYIGRGISSLGKPNKRENVFAIVKGKFTYNGILFCNTQFLILGMWNLKDGGDTLCTDSLGNFELTTWRRSDNANIYTSCEVLNRNVNFGDIRFSTQNLNLGINYLDMYFSLANLDSIKAATLLRLSPNPASATLQASYTLPSELIPAQTVLQISTLQGEALQSIALDAAEGLVTINLPVSLSNGTYLCSVLSNGVVYRTERFVVKR